MSSLRVAFTGVSRPACSDAGDEFSSVRKPLRILYVEDMPELRDVARISLGRDGHHIECVEDGEPAFALVTANLTAFDLIITDHHMPKMNGLELVVQLRALGFPGKILVFSSELARDVHAAYQRLNVDRIIYKPIFPSALRQVLVDLYPPALAESKP